jgi:hypothetical protein
MSRPHLAVVTVAVIGIPFLLPDSATARGGGAAAAAHAGHSRSVHHPPGRHWRGVRFRSAGIRSRLLIGDFGGVGIDGEPTSGLLDSRCRVERVQISDEYGWRVRDAVSCH